jgi:hypothetical protein
MSFSWLVMTSNAGAGVPLPETSANQVVMALVKKREATRAAPEP